ncbi:TIGR00730 family Rossman fold protein [Ancylobacter pratisalsi]|uniref:Cytokinin riboside 5'-monophosphate phosphoribohydrolase n=1 Tax=Ancylobacter pratisalsi TaxID=1745854 RepID=A0A6P1YSJ9_9HYPH|nr:TIGR00730 family Rossman fold protein [Ancylobacter pratisalsi]QIB35860.1 TIGR00730 family Rossman fold protein [Ancylobacter pratisalsi]
MRRLCVFLGSNPGRRPAYEEAAVALGRTLAREGIGLVYGGASVGLMGALANATLEAGGEVIGIIPQRLIDKEIGHRGLSDLRVVGSMHERKALMAELSDGFVALPGGVGTLEELFEVWTWAQLGSHDKPCAVLNVEGYYDGMLAFIDHVVEEGFMRGVHRDMLTVASDPAELLAKLRDYQPPNVVKWISRGEH